MVDLGCEATAERPSPTAGRARAWRGGSVDTAHWRSQFTDHDDPAKKRWLVRTWLRDTGAPSYDG